VVAKERGSAWGVCPDQMIFCKVPTFEENDGEMATRKWWKVENLFDFLISLSFLLLGKEGTNKLFISIFVLS
jgi:hypothetical protein